MSENLYCSGQKTFSKQGRENYDKIFREPYKNFEKIKNTTNRECKKILCDYGLWIPEKKDDKEVCNCRYISMKNNKLYCKLLY